MRFFKRNRCYNGGQKHHFEPRYNYKPSGIQLKRVDSIFADDLKELLILKVYIGDVCTWCGKVVNK